MEELETSDTDINFISSLGGHILPSDPGNPKVGCGIPRVMSSQVWASERVQYP